MNGILDETAGKLSSERSSKTVIEICSVSLRAVLLENNIKKV